MPASLQGISYSASARPLAPLSRIVLTIALTLVNWEERRRTRRVIGAMESHRLFDIGLDPETARIEAAKPFWRT